MMDFSARPPLVFEADRQWALARCPAWCARSAGATLEPPAAQDAPEVQFPELAEPVAAPAAYDAPVWDWLVQDEVEAFERYFAHERKPHAEWSRLWREKWFPRVDASKRFPKSAPHVAQPFFRAGSAEFARALTVGSAAECRIWQRFGIAQFTPDDARLTIIQRAAEITP